VGVMRKGNLLPPGFLFLKNYDVHVLFMLLTIGKASKLKIKKRRKIF
jgi:hypothetical protein